MRALIHYIVLSAIRDRLLIGMVAGLGFISYISYILGYTAIVEETTTAITLAAGVMRIMVMLGLIVFVCSHVRQMVVARELAVQLSRPISRTKLILAYFIGFRFVALSLLLPAFILLALMGPQDWGGYAAFCVSLIAEAAVVMAFCMFASFSLNSGVIPILASIGFYLLARLMGFFITTLLNHPLFSDWLTQKIASSAVDVVAIITPRLDFFAQSEWLHYGASLEQWLLFIAQAFIYVPLLLAATMLDVRRKDF